MNKSELEKLNQQISQAREDSARSQRLARLKQAATEELAALEQKEVGLQKELHKERRDVEKLEGKGLRAFFVGVFGDKEKRLDRERQEWAAARLKHEGALAEIASLRAKLEAMNRQSAEVAGSEERLQALLGEKEKAIMDLGGGGALELVAVDGEIGQLQELSREVEEALEAGRKAAGILKEVQSDLASAKGWGVFDILGGGLLATAVKHSKVSDARSKLTDAQEALRDFARELNDVKLSIEGLKVEIGGLATFGDYLFDGLIFDFVVQSKIKRSKENVDATLEEVNKLIGYLHTEQEVLAGNFKQLEDKRAELVESLVS